MLPVTPITIFLSFRFESIYKKEGISVYKSCSITLNCVIPKLFPYGEFLSYMKLTKHKLIETLRKKNQGWTTYQARKIARISIRRVNQVWKEYNETGEIPEIGKN